jgi:hypothetical protein
MRKLWLPAALLLTACTNAVSPGFESLPALIRECETHTARVCGTWTRSDNASTYAAVWSQGSTATIKAVQWTDDVIEFERTDTGGPTPKMKARYLAIRNGNTISFGQVRWSNDGLTMFGTWDATW